MLISEAWTVLATSSTVSAQLPLAIINSPPIDLRLRERSCSESLRNLSLFKGGREPDIRLSSNTKRQYVLALFSEADKAGLSIILRSLVKTMSEVIGFGVCAFMVIFSLDLIRWAWVPFNFE